MRCIRSVYRLPVRCTQTGLSAGIPSEEDRLKAGHRTPGRPVPLALPAAKRCNARGVNHYLLGTPPFALADYRRSLTRIAELDGTFDADRVGA